MATDGADDRIRTAADELYLHAPEGFVTRRAELAKAARAADDRAAATAIAGLARPTRAAWVVNRLARIDPDVVTALLDLGSELRAAQQELSADDMRELNDRRRALVRDVTRRAFGLAEIGQPSTALNDEVQNTLTAAVVDPAEAGAVVGQDPGRHAPLGGGVGEGLDG